MIISSCASRFGLIVSGLVLGSLSAVAADTGITIEAVDNYSCGALSNNIANVDGFRNRILSLPGTGYTRGVRFTNGNVFPTDFTDPEVVAGGADTFNFD